MPIYSFLHFGNCMGNKPWIWGLKSWPPHYCVTLARVLILYGLTCNVPWAGYILRHLQLLLDEDLRVGLA